MKKFILILPFYAVILFSCTEIKNDPIFNKREKDDIEEAIRVASIVRDSFFPDSKADGSEVDRASSYCDDGLYFVNYRSDKGYTVLSTFNGKFTAIAISENGHISNGKSGCAAFDKILNEFKSRGGGGILPPIPPDPGYYSQDTVITTTTKPRLCYASWHQRLPFNYYSGYVSSGTRRGAGCVPVAIGQIMTIFEYPDTLLLTHNNNDTLICDWFQMRLMDSDYSVGNEWGRANGRLMREIAERANADFTKDPISITSNNITPCLASFNYTYGSHQTYNFNSVKSSIDSDYPVLIYGTGYDELNESQGHAWLVDGYKRVITRVNWYYNTLGALPRSAGYEKLPHGTGILIWGLKREGCTMCSS